MFRLTENNFLNCGTCKYADEYGNTVFVRRTGDLMFTAKLRFADKNVRANRIIVNVEDVLNGVSVGESLHLEYESGVDIEAPNITNGINGFAELNQYLINMFSDLRFAWGKNDFLLKVNEGATEEDACAYKLSLLEQYEEVVPIMNYFNK